MPRSSFQFRARNDFRAGVGLLAFFIDRRSQDHAIFNPTTQSAKKSTIMTPQRRPFLGMNLLSFVKAVKIKIIVEVTQPAKPATHKAAQN